MTSFKETFKLAEKCIRPMIEEHGFKLDSVKIKDDNGSIWVHGSARYIEKNNWTHPFTKKRFVRIGIAPLRLELDLDIGIGDSCYTICELHELEGNQVFPERTHNLYKAMYDESQLKSEFERLVHVLKDCGSRFFSNDTFFQPVIAAVIREIKNMTIRQILQLGNPQLYEKSQPVFKEEMETIQSAVVDLHDTMMNFRNQYGVGRAIAAPQIGLMKNVLYMWVDEVSTVFINPRLVDKSEEMMEVWDDCMSFPDILVKVMRHKSCRILYRNQYWEEESMFLCGDLSELLQHEYDHLNGILAVARAIDGKSFALKSQKQLIKIG